MSRTATRSRFSLLASSSLIAANILAGMGALTATAFAPSVALAACAPDAAVTNDPGSVTETCAGADPVIDYTNVKHTFDVILDGENSPGGVSVSTDGSAQNLGLTNVLNASSLGSVSLDSEGGDIKIDFSDTAIPVTVTGGLSADAQTFGLAGTGNVTVLLGKNNTVGGTLFAGSDTGTVTVVNDGGSGFVDLFSDGAVNYSGSGAITSVTHGVIIQARDNGGPATGGVLAKFDGVITAAGNGIWVNNNPAIEIQNGLIDITTNKQVNATKDGINITGDGGIKLATNDAITGTLGAGVLLKDTSTSAVVPGIDYSANADVTGGNGGIGATEGGDSAIFINVKNAGTDVVGGTGTGIGVAQNGAGANSTVFVNTDAGTTVTGTQGISVANGAGAFTIIDAKGSVTGTTGAGVSVSGVSMKITTADVTGVTGGISTSGSGGITIDSTAGAVKATAGTGVSAATSPNNFITIDTADVSGVGGGISAVTSGVGGIDLDSSKGAVTTVGGTGVSVVSGSGQLTVVTADVTATGAATGGISALGAGNVSVNSTAGAVSTTGGIGVSATSTGKAVVVTTAAVNADNGDAILASTPSGFSTNVNNIGAVVSKNGRGIVVAHIGTGTTNVTADGAVTATDDGIFSNQTSGLLTVNINKVVTGDSDNNGVGDGVDLTVTTGQINVNISATGGIGGDSTDGILALANGAVGGLNSIIIKNDGLIGSGANFVDQDGIDASVVGDGNIKISGSGAIFAQQRGIVAVNNGPGTTTVDYGGFVLGLTGAGIDVSNNGGLIDINYSGLNAIGGTDGIKAVNTSNNPTGAIKITTSGSATGTNGDGISALTADGQINIDASGAGIRIQSTNGNGIKAVSAGDGDVFVNGSAGIKVSGGGAGDGILVASNTGDLNVGNTGGGYSGDIDPAGGGNGIKAAVTNAASAGNVFVATALPGSISGNANNGIVATTVGTGSVTVNAQGNIGTLVKAFVQNDGVLAGITNTTSTNKVSVTVGGVILAENNGVEAFTLGLGDVSASQTSGAIVAHANGISAVINNVKNVGGSVKVDQAAGAVINANLNGILATTNGEGDILVNANGVSAGGLAGAGDGIAAILNGPGLGASDGSVTVNLGATGVAQSLQGAGIKATTNSNDEVVVNTAGVSFGTTFGIFAQNTGVGGGVTVTQTGGQTLQVGADSDAGIHAEITQAGNSDQVWVNITGGSVTANGDGVFAQTAGTGLVKVNVGAGATVTGGNGAGNSNGDGVVAIGLGGGNVLVINDGTINGDPGIIASAVGFGTATTISGGAVAAVDQGILSTTEDGTNTVSITGVGTVKSTTSNGIEATSTKSATIDIKTAAGTKITTAGGGEGILAQQTGTGLITIQALGTIDAGNAGINATAASGTVDVVTGSGKITGGDGGAGFNKSGISVINGDGAITITTGTGAVGTLTPNVGFSFGIEAQTNGDIGINVGSGGIFDGGINAVSTGATGSSTIKVGGDITSTKGSGVATGAFGSGDVTVSLAAGKSITANKFGIAALSATGSVQVTAGVGSKITAQVNDGISASTGGAGTILITENGSIDTTAGAGTGIKAVTAGGAIQIFTGAGTINTGGRGILASAGGGKDITIHTGTGAITAAGLHGIRAGTAGGNIGITTDGDVTGQFGIEASTSLAGTVLVTTNGAVTGTAGDGIRASTDGTGTVTVISNGAVGATGVGINADGGAGKVTVLANSTVSGGTGGIAADGDGAGNVFVSALGAVDGGTGNGIKAESDTGNLDVTAASSVKGANGIISNTGGAGTTTIKAAGQITATAGNGVLAQTIGTGLIDITVAGVTATNHGAGAIATGAASIKITTTGNVIGDSDGDGFGAGVGAVSAGGDVTANLGGTVSGADGVVLITTGTGAVTLNGGAAGNSIVGTAESGIFARADTGPIVIGSGPGTRLQQTVSGKETGIDAESNGPITIFTANDISATNSHAVHAASAGAGAAVVVDTTGGAITAGANGIDAKSTGAGGTVNVVNTDGIEAGVTGIFAQGAGVTKVDNKGAIDASGKGTNGVLAISTLGPVQVDNTGAIGKAGAGNGVSNIGIGAVLTGGGANTVTVNNSGNIFVDTGGTAGILAVTTGTGDVTVNNTGVIDPPLYGIFMSGGGNVTANTAANVTGQLAGIHADSFGGSTKLVKVNVTAGAAVTGTAGNGIEAFGPIGANIIVDVTKSGAITGTGAGANGIFAQGKGDVTVSGGAGTITGGASGAAWGIKAIANPGGAGAGGVVKVTTGGLVTGAQGILAFSDGTDAGDSVTVTVNGNVTATNGFGILTKAVNGLNKVDLVTGTVSAVGKDGISASSTGTGGVTVTTAGGTNIEANSAGANDIKAVTTGASGDINVTTAGSLSLIGHAGNDAILAQVNNAASTSNINVTVQDQIWALNNAIEATTNGLGAITIVADTVAPASGFAIIDGHNNGINASITNAANASALNITVGDAGGAVSTSITQFNAGGNGILAANAGTGALNVTTGPGVSIFAAGAGSNGINAQGASGAVTVKSSGSSIDAANDGIFASGTGAISVTNASAINNASDAGIRVAGGAGQVDVTNTGSLASLNVAQFGIIAVDTTGKLTVTNSAAIGAAGAGNGVDNIGIAAVSTGAGANTVTVNNSGNIFVDAIGTAGILAVSNGTGDVTVNNAGVIDPPLYGIFVSSGGNATANTSANVTGQTGIRAQSFGGAGATATVKATNGAVITGTVGNGIEVFGTPANTKVDTTAGGDVKGAASGIVSTVTGNGTTTINTLTSSDVLKIKSVSGTGGDGIRASSNGAGAISITTGTVSGAGAAGNTSSGIVASSTGGGSITIAATGNISGDATGNAAGTGAAAISAVTTGAGNVTVTTSLMTNPSSGAVTAGNVGILAKSGATGSTSITSNEAITVSGATTVNGGAGPTGINATSGTAGAAVGAATSLKVAVNANIFANNGQAIVTNAGNNATVTIGAATVQGLGDATHAVVDVTGAVGSTTTLTNGGTITSKNAAPVSYGDLAVKASGGALVFNNNGTLLGRIDASKASSVTMTNTTFTSWHTTGTSTFSPGNDSLTNTGLIATNANAAPTTLDFGAGADSFTNSAGGVLVAGEGPQGAANLVITGLETLTNNGQVVFGSNSVVGPFVSDGVINDKINAAGTTFGGTGKLLMDADLFSISQASCAALTAADCLAVSATAGLNTIVVKDNGAHAVGAFNPTGIALVTGSTNAGANFKLDPTSSFYNPNKFGGVLDKPGLFFYDLAWSPANGGTSLLIGVPDTEAFELSEVSTQATSIWYTSTQTWFDRQADLRVTLAGRAEGWAPAVWLKVVGEWTDRDNTQTFSLFNKSYTFDVGYRQDTVGLIGGVDVLRGSNGTEGYVFGVQAGYLDSDVRFRSASRAKLSGPTFGVYGTYMNGGFFLDGIVNANFLNLDVSLPGIAPPSLTSASSDVRAYGGQIEGGYQMPIGANGFWEPIASLSYVHTDVHDLNLGAAGIATFPDATSFRGALGLRLGMTGDFQYYRVRATLTGRYINEFDGDNTLVFISPGPSNLQLIDSLNGGFGEVTLGTNMFATGGHLSAFANASIRFQSDYQATSVTAGFRYQW